MKRTDEATLAVSEPGCAEQLARFFPHASRVQLPVKITALRSGGTHLKETTIVEFGGAEHAIFLSTLPLEFDDRVRMERDGSNGGTEAAVIAVQYHEGRRAVAVRFLQGPCSWVTKS